MDVVSKDRVSDCCDAPVYLFGDATMCKDCKEYCDTHSDVCEMCLGTGFVDEMGLLDSHEPQLGYGVVGERICECQLNNSDE